MSELLPNVRDLVAALPATPAGEDAGRLAEAAASAVTWEAADDLLDALVDGWATP